MPAPANGIHPPARACIAIPSDPVDKKRLFALSHDIAPVADIPKRRALGHAKPARGQFTDHAASRAAVSAARDRSGGAGA